MIISRVKTHGYQWGFFFFFFVGCVYFYENSHGFPNAHLYLSFFSICLPITVSLHLLTNEFCVLRFFCVQIRYIQALLRISVWLFPCKSCEHWRDFPWCDIAGPTMIIFSFPFQVVPRGSPRPRQEGRFDRRWLFTSKDGLSVLP